VLASEHAELDCSIAAAKMRGEGETSSDSNTVAEPCFSEGARHSTCSIVLLWVQSFSSLTLILPSSKSLTLCDAACACSVWRFHSCAYF
jgi:hypothetical protein